MRATIIKREVKSVPCETCGHPTTYIGTKRCDNCWQVERRLKLYLRSERGRDHVAQALGEAIARVPRIKEDTDETYARAGRLYKGKPKEPCFMCLGQGFIAHSDPAMRKTSACPVCGDTVEVKSEKE